jgi:hypothetical protein
MKPPNQSALWNDILLATAASTAQRRYYLWQAFCLAKQASIGYTARIGLLRRTVSQFGDPIRPVFEARGGAE